MSIIGGYQAGQIAKSICAKPRSRLFWNCFFGWGIIIILFWIFAFVHQVVSERYVYESEQIYVEYKDGYLFTDSDSYEIAKYENQDVDIYTLMREVNPGDKIKLILSDITEELLAVDSEGEIIYKKEPTPILPCVIIISVVALPLMVGCVYSIVAVNTKKPTKAMRKLRNKYMLEEDKKQNKKDKASL